MTSVDARSSQPRPPRPAAILSLALLAVVSAGCGGGSTEEYETSDKVPVVLQAARRGPARSIVAAMGTVRPAPGAELLVVAPEPARIAEMPRGVGDRVARGDLLVRFEIPSLDAEISAKESEVKRAEARYASAQASLARVEGLFDRGIAARREVEDARREMAEAEAAVSESKSGRSATGRIAGRGSVRAPFAGIVASRSHNPGDLVDASAAEPILRLIDPDRLQVEATVPVADLPSLTEGRPARVFGPSSYAPEDARVLALPASADPTTATVVVRLGFAARSRLPAGTPVSVEIAAVEHADALLVPSAAVVKDGEDTYVYTVGPDAKAHRKKVEVGLSTGADVEILSGLAAGERVVVEGQNALPDGAAVTVRP